MKSEDYEQYYQKGGTYVMPVEVFNELFEEMENWREETKRLIDINKEHQEINGKLREENKQYESDIKKLMYDIENLERLEKQHQELNGKLREELNIYKNIINLFDNGKIYFNEMMEKFKELEESGK